MLHFARNNRAPHSYIANRIRVMQIRLAKIGVGQIISWLIQIINAIGIVHRQHGTLEARCMPRHKVVERSAPEQHNLLGRFGHFWCKFHASQRERLGSASVRASVGNAFLAHERALRHSWSCFGARSWLLPYRQLRLPLGSRLGCAVSCQTGSA